MSQLQAVNDTQKSFFEIITYGQNLIWTISKLEKWSVSPIIDLDFGVAVHSGFYFVVQTTISVAARDCDSWGCCKSSQQMFYRN